MYIIAATFALTSLVNGATLPHRLLNRDTDAAPTCSGKAQGTVFTYSSSSSTFDVVCGKDYFGGDLRSLQADSFEDCLKACDSEVSCITLAYRDGACYLKSHVASLTSDTAVWSARKQTGSAPLGLSCVDSASDGQTYQVGSNQFKIVCGQEYYGGDLAYASTSSFETCIAACAANTQCVDVSYVSGACYLKQSTSSLVSAPQVWTAQLVITKTKLSCSDSKDNGKSYTGKNGGLYTVECGLDHYGGDFAFVDGTTFESCMDACDATTGCVDVSWVYGACYLKNTVNSGMTASQVWTGRLVSGAQLPSSSSPSSSEVLALSTSSPALLEPSTSSNLATSSESSSSSLSSPTPSPSQSSDAAATSTLQLSTTTTSSLVSSSDVASSSLPTSSSITTLSASEASIVTSSASSTPSPSSTPTPDVNYLPNGDFETGVGTNTTGASIPGWINPLGLNSLLLQRMEINGNLARSGNGALTLTQVPRTATSLRNQIGTMILIPRAKPLLPVGSVFKFSAWTRQLTPNACTASLYCGVSAPGEQYLLNSQTVTPSATEWSQVTFSCFPPQTGTTHVQITVTCAAGNPWAQVSFDDLSIRGLPSA
ncbi:hypothetical protein OPT61_g5977 [Boeremia exigua]|uniref:Uncharacterized protein n=1 Tax=Boeremia exigua TaxID=749465 RepID=A0ACC2I8C5_9PLEO|nr:hypothetical protein OPT61_g5977 [Boeremia exigua]